MGDRLHTVQYARACCTRMLCGFAFVSARLCSILRSSNQRKETNGKMEERGLGVSEGKRAPLYPRG